MSRYPHFNFKIEQQDTKTKARIGLLQTPHGDVETPNFIFCATKASIKGVTTCQVKQANTQIILANTYHLMLQPGAETVERLGGLHKMMGWDGPMLTDSGGFQIFSLGHGSVASEIKRTSDQQRPKTMLKISEEGATFRSYLDGSKHTLTPEKSIDVQRKLGPDIILVLDECTPFNVDKDYTARSMNLSHRWAKRSLDEFDRGNNGKQALYGIIQGGVYEDLRKEAADYVNDQPFFGHAIGGSLGADKAQMAAVVKLARSRLKDERPVHLLGIGGIGDIWRGVAEGIDTFDCVHPTRIARHGCALHPEAEARGREHLNLKNARHKEDNNPIDEKCSCTTCQKYSRGYLHHLLKAKELLAFQLISIHNIYYMNQVVADIREAIKDGSFAEKCAPYQAIIS